MSLFLGVDPMLHQNDCHCISIRKKEGEERQKERNKDTVQEREMVDGRETLRQKENK